MPIATTSNSISKLIQYLDEHILKKDQPATCPRCGIRTEDDYLLKNKQVCHCTGCHYTFIGSFE